MSHRELLHLSLIESSNLYLTVEWQAHVSICIDTDAIKRKEKAVFIFILHFFYAFRFR